MSRVLWFHPRPLLPPRGGSEIRIAGLVRAVVDAGHEVLVVQPGTNDEQPHGFEILELQLPSKPMWALAKMLTRGPLRAPRVRRSARTAARQKIETFAPDLGIVSDVMSWTLARHLMPDIPWIHDAHNVEQDLFRDLAAEAGGMLDRVTFAIDRRRVRRAEGALIRDADALVVVSREDAERFAELGLKDRAVVVPSSVPTPEVGAGSGPVVDPVLVFVGTLDYPPNVKAVEELATAVFPSVRQSMPDARLQVVGRRPTSSLRLLVEATDGAVLLEDVPDLGPIYSAAACAVMPIRSGGGSRLKVYEALAHGVPVVATPNAVAGVELRPGVALIKDSSEDLARASLEVLRSPDLRAALSQAGREHFLEVLSWRQAAAPLVELVEDLAPRR